MSEIIQRISTPRTAVLLFVLFLVFSGVLFNWGYYANITSSEVLIDSTFNYTPSRAYELLTNYGEAGRTNYLHSLPNDYVYSALMALSMITALTALTQRLFPHRKLLQKIYWIPLLAGVADYLENVGLYRMLSNYPEQLDGVAVATNLFTMTKLSLVGTSFLLFALFGIALLVKRQQSKR